MSNGLLLTSHIHQCFDRRLLSIDPDTRRIRAFMPYNLITEYHGKQASLPEAVNLRTLRHHYDMCCIENMATKKQPGMSISLGNNVTRTILSASPHTTTPAPGDPSKAGRPQDEASGAETTSKANNQGGTAQECLDHPLSPPPSEPGDGQKRRTWRVGGLYVTDTQEVDRLKTEGWLVYKVNEESDPEESDYKSEEEERGQPRKRQCVMTP